MCHYQCRGGEKKNHHPYFQLAPEGKERASSRLRDFPRKGGKKKDPSEKGKARRVFFFHYHRGRKERVRRREIAEKGEKGPRVFFAGSAKDKWRAASTSTEEKRGPICSVSRAAARGKRNERLFTISVMPRTSSGRGGR